MIFLSLLVDLMLMFGGAGAFNAAETEVVAADAHRTHGHLPGPPLGGSHYGNTHEHHGQHGHFATASGGNHPHDPQAGR